MLAVIIISWSHCPYSQPYLLISSILKSSFLNTSWGCSSLPCHDCHSRYGLCCLASLHSWVIVDDLKSHECNSYFMSLCLCTRCSFCLDFRLSLDYVSNFTHPSEPILWHLGQSWSPIQLFCTRCMSLSTPPSLAAFQRQGPHFTCAWNLAHTRYSREECWKPVRWEFIIFKNLLLCFPSCISLHVSPPMLSETSIYFREY